MILGVMLLAVPSVHAVNVSTKDQLEEAVKNGGEITLTEDITEITSLEIAEGKNVILDLNGKSITTALKSEGRHHYAFDVYGTLTINDSKGTGSITARGIENFGGTITVNGGTIISQDTNGGAAIWNDNLSGRVDDKYYIRTSNFDLTDENDLNAYNELKEDEEVVISNFDDDYTYTYSGYASKNDVSGKYYYLYYKYEVKSQGKLIINGGTFKTLHVGSSSDSSGPGCVNNKGYAEIHGGTFESPNLRTYAVISTGDIKVDESKGKVVVNGAHGGISVDYGTAIIDGGSYSSTEYYGFWITNNGKQSDVTRNGDTFKGRYGLYAQVDDGKQDVGDVSIKINGGTFIGNTKSAAAINPANSENEWGMDIKGGTFNSSVNKYVHDGYSEYKVADKEYVVDKETKVTFLNEVIYLELGKELENAFKVEGPSKVYYEATISNDSVATLNKTTLKGLKVGKTTLTISVSDGTQKEVEINVYELKNTTVESKSENIEANSVVTNDTKKQVDEVVSNVINSTLNGEELSGVVEKEEGIIKESIESGKEIGSKLITTELSEEELKEDVKLAEKVVSKDSKISGYYDVSIIITANDEKIGNITELDEALMVTLPLPENLPKLEKGFERSYTITRVHDGVATTLKTIDNKDGTISFESDKYSSFILSYVDSEIVKSPNTGDKIIKYLVLSIISLGVVGVAFKKLKEKINN